MYFNYLCDIFYLNPEAHAEAANTSVADPVKPRVSAKKKRSSRHVPAMLPVSVSDDNSVPDPPTARGMRVRKRADVIRTDNDQAAALRRMPLEWLQWGKASFRYESKGWLVDELLHYSIIEDSDVGIWKRVISDYRHVSGVIEGMRLVQGTAFKDPCDHVGIPDPLKGGLFVSASGSSQARIPRNEWTIPYLLDAYNVKRTTFQRRLLADIQGPLGRAIRIYQHTVLDAYQHTALGLVPNINPEETTSCGLTLA